MSDNAQLQKHAPAAIGVLAIIVLAIVFRHSAIVRGIALFLLCPPLAYAGWMAGNAIRTFVMPDFIVTSGGFSGLLKARLFWAVGPQAIGAGIGALIGYIVVLNLFPPAPAPLSTVAQWKAFDGEAPSDFINDEDVRQHVIATLAGLLPRNPNLAAALGGHLPASAFETLKQDLRYGDKISVMAEDRDVSLAAYGCAEEHCRSGRGVFLGIAGREVRKVGPGIGVTFLAVATEEGIQSSPPQQLPSDLVPAYETWVAQIQDGVSQPQADEDAKTRTEAPPPAPAEPQAVSDVEPPKESQAVPTAQEPAAKEEAPAPPQKTDEIASASEAVAQPVNPDPAASAPAPSAEAARIDAAQPLSEQKSEQEPEQKNAPVTSSPPIPASEVSTSSSPPAAQPQAGIAPGPSFDCAKASSPQEKLICSDPGLAALDRILADVYRAALQQSSDPVALKREQLGWVRTARDPCQDQIVCMSDAYKARIAALAR